MPRKKSEPERRVVITITGTTPDQHREVEHHFVKMMSSLQAHLGKKVMGTIQVQFKEK